MIRAWIVLASLLASAVRANSSLDSVHDLRVCCLPSISRSKDARPYANLIHLRILSTPTGPAEVRSSLRKSVPTLPGSASSLTPREGSNFSVIREYSINGEALGIETFRMFVEALQYFEVVYSSRGVSLVRPGVQVKVVLFGWWLDEVEAVLFAPDRTCTARTHEQLVNSVEFNVRTEKRIIFNYVFETLPEQQDVYWLCVQLTSSHAAFTLVGLQLL